MNNFKERSTTRIKGFVETSVSKRQLSYKRDKDIV